MKGELLCSYALYWKHDDDKDETYDHSTVLVVVLLISRPRVLFVTVFNAYFSSLTISASTPDGYHILRYSLHQSGHWDFPPPTWASTRSSHGAGRLLQMCVGHPSRYPLFTVKRLHTIVSMSMTEDLFYKVNPAIVQVLTGGELLLLKFTTEMRKAFLC